MNESVHFKEEKKKKRRREEIQNLHIWINNRLVRFTQSPPFIMIIHRVVLARETNNIQLDTIYHFLYQRENKTKRAYIQCLKKKNNKNIKISPSRSVDRVSENND